MCLSKMPKCLNRCYLILNFPQQSVDITRFNCFAKCVSQQFYAEKVLCSEFRI